MKTWTQGFFCAVACMAISASAFAAELSWYVDDGPDAGGWKWSDITIGPFWEYMTVTVPEDDECSIADLPWPPPDGVAYHACTPLLTDDYSGYDFWAELWLANNYEDSSSPVTVELWRGAPAALGTRLAQTSITVTSYPDPELYVVTFGAIDPLVLTGESLIVKIIYGGQPGDTHIYWDALSCPTGLFGELVGTPNVPTSWSQIKAVYR